MMMYNYICVVFCWIITTVISLPVDHEESCGYQSCHPGKEGFVNIHIVPHTHDDVGWLKTVDQYYYGSNSTIQRAGVQYILDSVLDALRKDSSRRFIYVETAFLWKWWIKQHDIVKSQFKKLIKNGQLEIIGGAWSMNDEAATHYQSIIDQFTWGLRKLSDSFGDCARPKIGWQIDPFGHSREMASIFSQLGFDGIFLGRIDYQDKITRFNTTSAEIIWRSSGSLGNSSNIFTSILFNTYSPPPGFCFDILCNDDPIIDNKKSPEYNIERKVQNFLDYVKKMKKVYRTNNVLVTMGEDFNYQDAHVWFKNLDKLIRYVNAKQEQGSKFNALYSTPSCYLKAVYDEATKKKLKWLVKFDDFFPYASDNHTYWTGYFTSRPTIKRFERIGNNYLQVCKQLYALADLGPEDKADLNAMREAMGVMQHHDAVTGTEKQHVANDYARILSQGFEECGIATTAALEKLSNSKEKPSSIPYETCHFNISECAFTEKQSSFIVTIYNPLSRPVNHYVRLPIRNQMYAVLDPEGNSLFVERIPIPTPITKIPGRNSSATHELVFLASNIPPLGFKSFYISKSNATNEPKNNEEDSSTLLAFNNENVDIGFSYDPNTGFIAEIYINGRTITTSQQFFYYRGAVGNNEVPENRSSGAYIFRPNTTSAYKISEKATVNVYRGSLIAELRQVFNDWVSQTIRVYSQENLIEFDWLIGPIPENDVNGKEVITRYITKLASDSTFYTDSNGRELLKRVRNFRPTWKVDIKENISANYYPITSKILIRDVHDDLEFSILTDRAEGGSSLSDGEIELMLHRDCLSDDAFGVGEALKEKAFGKGLVVRGSHYLTAGSYLESKGKKSLAALEKDIAQRKLLSAWTFLFSTNGLSYKEYKTKHRLQFEGLSRALPDNVQILTLEPWIGMSLLLRLEHVFELNEDSNLSTRAEVVLTDLFIPFEITSLKETTLGGNQWLNENDRLKFDVGTNLENLLHWDSDVDLKWKRWKENQRDSNNINDNLTERNIDEESIADVGTCDSSKFVVYLEPMQIRTFVIEIKKK